MPRNFSWRAYSDSVEIETDRGKITYEEYIPGVPLTHDEESCNYCDPVLDAGSSDHHPGSFVPPEPKCSQYDDVVITGETDFEHAKAWGEFKFFGRVRSFDGLIVMVRISVSLFIQR